MPRGDRTGPEGRGPLTGRRAGYCAGENVPGYANEQVPPMGMGRGFGRGGGRGRGRGGGRGWGRGGGRGWGRGQPGPYPDYVPPPVQAPVVAQDEVAYLEGAAESLEADLKAVKDRIKELKKPKKE